MQLWKSDGTTDGTVLVKDIQPGAVGWTAYELTAVGNTLFFGADDGVYGSELWKSDGTTDGTVMVADINPTGDSSPGFLTAVGNTLFFAASDGNGSMQLWKSDGTEAGTMLVKDINPGARNSGLDNLTAVGNTLFFSADDGVHGRNSGRVTARRTVRFGSRTSGPVRVPPGWIT